MVIPFFLLITTQREWATSCSRRKNKKKTVQASSKEKIKLSWLINRKICIVCVCRNVQQLFIQSYILGEKEMEKSMGIHFFKCTHPLSRTAIVVVLEFGYCI